MPAGTGGSPACRLSPTYQLPPPRPRQFAPEPIDFLSQPRRFIAVSPVRRVELAGKAACMIPFPVQFAAEPVSIGAEPVSLSRGGWGGGENTPCLPL
jgi:hypothetical protein